MTAHLMPPSLSRRDPFTAPLRDAMELYLAHPRAPLQPARRPSYGPSNMIRQTTQHGQVQGPGMLQPLAPRGRAPAHSTDLDSLYQKKNVAPRQSVRVPNCPTSNIVPPITPTFGRTNSGPRHGPAVGPPRSTLERAHPPLPKELPRPSPIGSSARVWHFEHCAPIHPSTR